MCVSECVCEREECVQVSSKYWRTFSLPFVRSFGSFLAPRVCLPGSSQAECVRKEKGG